MAVHNIGRELAEGINYVSKTATATLTRDEIYPLSFITATHASSAIALTLPAASIAYKGCRVMIACGGAAAVTVVVTAGFGGAGASGDTATLAQGDFCECFCNGSSWFVNNVTTAA